MLSTDEAYLNKDKEASHQAWRMKSDKPAAGDRNTPIGIGDADFIMVSDADHKIIRNYGVEGEDGLALRATFFIDKQGKVQISEVQMNSIGRGCRRALPESGSTEICRGKRRHAGATGLEAR